jgi:plastocyanin
MQTIRWVAGVMLALSGASAMAATTLTITANPNLTFSFDPPDEPHQIHAGDSVEFINGGGFHNAVSDTGAITEFTTGAASSDPWDVVVTFPTAGTEGFHCEIHQRSGMVGSFEVLPATSGSPVVEVSTTTIDAGAQEGMTAVVPFTIGNTGDADLDWTVDESLSDDCSTTDDVPWLSLDPTGGTVASGAAAASVNVTFDATTLVAGLYNAAVCVHSNDAVNPLVAVPVAFTVSADDTVFKDGFDTPTP